MRVVRRRTGSAEPEAGAHAARQGAWYPDPYGLAALRWWDGTAWTGYVHGPIEQHPDVGNQTVHSGGHARPIGPRSQHATEASAAAAETGTVAADAVVVDLPVVRNGRPRTADLPGASRRPAGDPLDEYSDVVRRVLGAIGPAPGQRPVGAGRR